MQCPSCTEEMITVDFKGVQIEECSNCHGRWFDRGELKKAKDHTDEDLIWLDFDPFDMAISKDEETPEGVLCPKCGVEMRSLEYRDSNIFIDKCEQCHGVWLHHDEFEKIIKYLEDLVSSETATDFVKDSFHQFVDIAQHKKGISEGLKDYCVILKLLRQRIGVEHPKLSEAVNKIYEFLPFL